MRKKLRLTKLELATREGKKVELTLEEARELYEQLDELFCHRDTTYILTTPIVIDRHYSEPYWQNGEWCTSYQGIGGMTLVCKGTPA